MPKFKKQTELKTIGNYIYGFQNYSQAQSYKGIGLEKSKGKLNEVYVVLVGGLPAYGMALTKDASHCKAMIEQLEGSVIAVKQRESKPFKHPKQKQIEKEAERIISEFYEENKDDINRDSINRAFFGI